MKNFRRSQELFEEAQRYLPGGVDSPVRAFKAVGGNPLFIERGKGSRIYDVDGNEVVGVVKYEFARHELRNISINGEGDLNGILVDDGYGKKIWKTWAEYRNQ